MDGEGGRERMAGVGSLLRACRLRAGVTLFDAAEFLNIRRCYLHAIEDERYGDLPGPPYAVGFVRCYAEYLALDGNEAVRRFRAETAELNGAAARKSGARGTGSKRGSDLRFPLAASETATPDGSVLLVGAMLALVAYGGWYAFTASDGLVSDLIAPLPARFASLLPGAAVSSPGSPAAPPTVLAAPKARPVEPPAERVVVPAAPVPLEAPQSTPVAGASTAKTAPSGESSATVAHASATDAGAADAETAAARPRVSLEASEPSWVEIRDHVNKRVVSRLMAPGDVLDVPDQAGLRLTVGNAGGLVIRIDGHPVPPLGGSGVVLRNVPLESARLQQAVASAN